MSNLGKAQFRAGSEVPCGVGALAGAEQTCVEEEELVSGGKRWTCANAITDRGRGSLLIYCMGCLAAKRTPWAAPSIDGRKCLTARRTAILMVGARYDARASARAWTAMQGFLAEAFGAEGD